VTGTCAMTRPDGCHDDASDQAIRHALKKLSQRCEFVANRRPCYTRARIAGKKNSHEWSDRAMVDWANSGTTVKKSASKPGELLALKWHGQAWSWHGR